METGNGGVAVARLGALKEWRVADKRATVMVNRGAVGIAFAGYC